MDDLGFFKFLFNYCFWRICYSPHLVKDERPPFEEPWELFASTLFCLTSKEFCGSGGTSLNCAVNLTESSVWGITVAIARCEGEKVYYWLYNLIASSLSLTTTSVKHNEKHTGNKYIIASTVNDIRN